MFGVFLFSLAIVPTTETIVASKSEVEGPCLVAPVKNSDGTPPVGCASARNSASTAKEKSILLFAWGYSLSGAGQSREAIGWLDQAVALAPNFSNARGERAYVLNDLGFFQKALIDSNVHVSLSPELAQSYSERAFARHRLADFEGSLADLRKAESLGDKQAFGTATELMWLGRYDEAHQALEKAEPLKDVADLLSELDRRSAYRPDGREAERCDVGQNVGERETAQRLVDSCTWLFDHEKDRKKRAGYMTSRAIFGVVARQDRGSAIPDYQIAVALDPNNPQWHSNYGYALVGINHSWAGRNSLNDALSFKTIDQRTRAIALAGRGYANLNLGDVAAAKADALESFRLKPSEVNVWLLGDVAKAEGDLARAKKFWLEAYRLGARDDGLIESLKEVGVVDPAKETK